MSSTSSAAGATPSAVVAAKRRRDIRLDFFRGLGMFIILIAHIPYNTWTNWIPARFGYSDATEIFVFCSGAASALAFLKVFQNRGWLLGTARISFRIWQIYWCHIGVFLAIAGALAFIDATLDNERFYTARLNLIPFFENTPSHLIGLLTLSYVPNYFDILAMYIVILALLPIVAALGLWRREAAFVFVIGLYLAANQPWLAFLSVPVFEGLNPPARPGTELTWFFNPFAWQLIFFTGFAFAVGWLPKPPIKKSLMWLAAAVLLFGFVFDPDGVPFWRLLNLLSFEELRAPLREFNDVMATWKSKTFFGLFRYVHFLALAYLAWSLAGDYGARIPQSGLAGQAVTVVRRVGQQSLAVFIASLLIARLLGVYINETGRGDLMVIASANLIGFALIIGVAYGARWYRRQPWRDAPAASPTPVAPSSGARPTPAE